MTVTATEKLAPQMLRVRFASPDLADFESAGADDHVKLFVPDGEGGMAMRDYTPRSFDMAGQTLVIDFALHDDGPATRWALGAKPGDTVQVGGPRGSTIVPDDFDWYLLIGDETAIPSISRRIEELRAGVPITALIAIDTLDDRVPLPERDGLTVRWCPRDDGSADDGERLVAAVDAQHLPPGDGFVWIAAEGSAARVVRAHIIDDLGHERSWVKASGYWSAGDAGKHDKIGD